MCRKPVSFPVTISRCHQIRLFAAIHADPALGRRQGSPVGSTAARELFFAAIWPFVRNLVTPPIATLA